MTNSSTGMFVVAVALLDDCGQVLMQKRREKAMHGGLWEFPGGKLEKGESAREAAVREISEELGLAIEPGDLVPVGFASGPRPDSDGAELVILLYSCARWRGNPQCRSADALGWFEIAGLAGLAMPPLDYPLAAALAALPRAPGD